MVFDVIISREPCLYVRTAHTSAHASAHREVRVKRLQQKRTGKSADRYSNRDNYRPHEPSKRDNDEPHESQANWDNLECLVLQDPKEEPRESDRHSRLQAPGKSWYR